MVTLQKSEERKNHSNRVKIFFNMSENHSKASEKNYCKNSENHSKKSENYSKRVKFTCYTSHKPEFSRCVPYINQGGVVY